MRSFFVAVVVAAVEFVVVVLVVDDDDCQRQLIWPYRLLSIKDDAIDGVVVVDDGAVNVMLQMNDDDDGVPQPPCQGDKLQLQQQDMLQPLRPAVEYFGKGHVGGQPVVVAVAAGVANVVDVGVVGLDDAVVVVAKGIVVVGYYGAVAAGVAIDAVVGVIAVDAIVVGELTQMTLMGVIEHLRQRLLRLQQPQQLLNKLMHLQNFALVFFF